MRLRQRPRPWMLVSAGWITIAALAAINDIAMHRMNGQPWSLRDIVFAGGGPWMVFVVLTPGVFFAAQRWPIAGPHLGRHAVLHIGFALLFWLIASTIYQGILAGLFDPNATEGATTFAQVFQQLSRRVFRWVLNTLSFCAVVYGAIVGIAHASRYFAEARDRELQMHRMSEQLATARFAALQSQLNPHFLFNTLNTIAVRARDGDGPGTVRMVERLSEVLRRTLGRHRANEVTLDEEIELVREYLAIEEARFSDRLTPTFDIDDAALAGAVPSFAVQHLVENAIRHGIAKRPGSGHVGVAARREGDLLIISVTDDGPGIGPDDAAADGHGLANTRERVQALHGERASLTLTPAPGGGAIATLRVPYREIPRGSSVA